MRSEDVSRARGVILILLLDKSEKMEWNEHRDKSPEENADLPIYEKEAETDIACIWHIAKSISLKLYQGSINTNELVSQSR